jgi:VIT1/CCC1 family predicted Fe2+/Mn2+ transporter
MSEDNSLQPSPAQVAAAAQGAATHGGEPHAGSLGSRLNWLRAGVLGANDGIVSVAGLVVGVAGATLARAPILTAGLAGLVAGAVSMALGEYVSVSSQRDTELAQLATEERELRQAPDTELAELAAIYQAKGLSPATAHTVAQELTAHNALTAHLDAELELDPEQLTKPGHAATSALSSLSVRCYHWWRFCSHPPVGEYPSPSSRSWSPWP